jgi:hypothetical protein
MCCKMHARIKRAIFYFFKVFVTNGNLIKTSPFVPVRMRCIRKYAARANVVLVVVIGVLICPPGRNGTAYGLARESIVPPTPQRRLGWSLTFWPHFDTFLTTNSLLTKH